MNKISTNVVEVTNKKVDKEKIEEDLKKMQETVEYVEVMNKVKNLYKETKDRGELLPIFLTRLEQEDKGLKAIIENIIKVEEPSLWEKDSFMQQVILTGILTKALVISTKYERPVTNGNSLYIPAVDELLSLLRYDFIPTVWLNIAVEEFIPKFKEVRYIIEQYYNEYYKNNEGVNNE